MTLVATNEKPKSVFKGGKYSRVLFKEIRYVDLPLPCIFFHVLNEKILTSLLIHSILFVLSDSESTYISITFAHTLTMLVKHYANMHTICIYVVSKYVWTSMWIIICKYIAFDAQSIFGCQKQKGTKCGRAITYLPTFSQKRKYKNKLFVHEYKILGCSWYYPNAFGSKYATSMQSPYINVAQGGISSRLWVFTI